MNKKAIKLFLEVRKEEREFLQAVEKNRMFDRVFAAKGDEPLTDDEIAAIDDFWSKYKFAYPNVDYTSYKIFKNRCGRFDVRHFPGNIRSAYLRRHFFDENYAVSFQNKGMFDTLYPDLHKPHTVLRRMKGIYYDTDYNPVTLVRAVNICCRHVKNVGNLIVKPSGLGGGNGIVFLTRNNATPEFVRKIFAEDLEGRSFVVQEVLKQSAFMARLNPSSVNTIRITTFLFKRKVTPLAALVRVGNPGAEVDNWCAGGSLLGVDIQTGKCFDWAMAKNYSRVDTLSSGICLKDEELVIPNFDKVKEVVTRAHYRIPYIKLISWDIALDADNEPTFIECNFAGMIQIHEAITGPIFGELTEQVYDEYLLKWYYKRFVTRNFLCKEYYDRVEIQEYIGKSHQVVIPETLRGKPVTRVEPTALKGCKISSFTASDLVKKNSPTAMRSLTLG